MTRPEHITPADGNVFEDVGFPPGEARNLLIRSMLMLTAEQFIDSLINMLTNAGVPVEVRAAGNAA